MKRNGLRRFVFGLAVACFSSAAIVAGICLWAALSLGVGDVATASFFAISLFLGCCGVVLYFVSLPPRPIITD
jgi:hypothetical protein